VKRALVVGGPGPITEALARRLRDSPRVACAVESAEPVVETTGEGEGADGGGAAALRERLSGGCDHVVYVAAERRPADGRRDGLPNPADAGVVFDTCAAAEVAEVTVLSSAAVHEPSHHHPGMVSEERLAPLRFGNRIAARWRELESLVEDRLGRGGLRRVVLRPVTVVGAGPGGPVDATHNAVSRRLTARLALTLPGHEPSVQLLSVDDLAETVARVVEAQGDELRGGTYHVAPERPVPLRKALRRAGVWRLPVPRWMQELVRSADELAYVRYPWTVAGERLVKELGFTPRRSSAEVALALRRTAKPRGGESGREGSVSRGSTHEDQRGFDQWGLDPAYLARFERTLFRFLHDVYWRVELAGLEHLPREGAAVLTGVHRGFQPWDGVMVLVGIHRATGRIPRFLLHPTLVKFPFLANYMTKLGGVHACRENADRILGRGDLLGIYPEGIRGAFTSYRRAYRLRKFGRDEFVKMALRHRAPIVPFVTVGSAEIFPILGKLDWGWWKRWTEWPCFPITPTLGLVPLPSKWHTLFLPPVAVEEYLRERRGAEVAEDPEVVKTISRRVRRSMATAFEDILARRRSIFWGSVFGHDGEAEGSAEPGAHAARAREEEDPSRPEVAS